MVEIASAGVAANPAAGAVGDGAASAVVDADEHPVGAVQLDGLRSAEMPLARDGRRVPGPPVTVPDVVVQSIWYPGSGNRGPGSKRSSRCATLIESLVRHGTHPSSPPRPAADDIR